MSFTDFKIVFQKDYKRLKFPGIWLDIDESEPPKWFKIYSFICRYLFIYSLSFISFFNWILNSRNLQDFAKIGHVVLMCIVAAVKIIIILTIKYDDFYNLMKLLDHPEFQPRNEYEISITTKSVKYLRKVQMINGVGIFATITCAIFPLFSWKQRQLPIVTWYPFDLDSILVFALVYFNQIVAVSAIGSMNCVVELILMPGCLIFLRLQCELLCGRLKEVKENAKEDEISLNRCVKDLNNIFEFQTLLSKTFGVTHFWQMLCTAATLCMVLFLLQVTDPKSLEFTYLFGYLIAISSCLAFPCWLATEMTAMGDKIPVAISNSDWIDCSIEFKKDLCFFLLHSQRPIKLYAGKFFEISIATFLSIMRSSYSYFAIMQNLDSDV